MNQTIIDRLLKIKALADDERTPEYERVQARSMLSQLIEKYGIDPDSLEFEPKQKIEFSYSKTWERKLIIQLVGHIRGASNVIYYNHTNNKGRKLRKVSFKLTKAEAQKVTHLYDIYRKAFIGELDDMMNAFIHKHDLYTPSDEPAMDLTHDELLQWERIKRKATQLNDVQIREALEDGNHYE